MPTDWGSLKVVDLKEECRSRNLLVGGKKAELVARLEEYEASEMKPAVQGKEPSAAGPSETPGKKSDDAEEDAEEDSAGNAGGADKAGPATSHKKTQRTTSKTADKADVSSAKQADSAAAEIVTADIPAPSSPPEHHTTDDNAARHESAHAASTPVENTAAATAESQKQPTTAARTRTAKRASQKATPASEEAPAGEPAVQDTTAAKTANTPAASTPAATPAAQDPSTAATPVVEGSAPAPGAEAPAMAATPVLEAATPAVEAPATQPNTAADAGTPLVPATEVKVPEDSDATGAMDIDIPDTAKRATPAAAAAGGDAPMETRASDSAKQASAKDTAADAAPEMEANDDVQQQAATPVQTVPLAASLTDVTMTEAAAEDAEAVRYDEPEEEMPPAKDQKPAKIESDRKSSRQEPRTAQKAADVNDQQGAKSQSAKKEEAREPKTAQKASDAGSTAGGLISASARKRSRDEQAAKDDRKAPRTEHKTDVKDDRKAPRTENKHDARPSHSQREKDKERAADRDKDRSSRANGDAPSEQRRKHAPISYKPPERQTSGTKRDEPTEEARKAPTADRKDSAGKAGLEQQTSGLDRSVSRTESGQKLSVFERLRRSEGSGVPPLPANRDSPAAAVPPPTRQVDPPLSRTSSHSRRNQPTRALRIDGFVRPFTEPMARAMLSKTGEVEGMWMPTIRTHAFVIYATQEQAEATLAATMDNEWPQGNHSRLIPKFVAVVEAEAAIARAGGAGPTTAAAPAVAALQPRGAQDAQAKAEPSSRETDTGRRSDERRADVRAERPRTGEQDDRRHRRDGDERRGRDEDRRRLKDEPMPLAAEPTLQMPEEPLTLDDLFRKTDTKPALYWLPLTEQQAADQAAKHEAEAAAAAKSETGAEVNGIVAVA